jgi:lysyl-tRNA synthetase class 2
MVRPGPENPRTVARLLGVLVAIAGAATVCSSLATPWSDRLHLADELLTPGVTHAASGVAALSGLALLLVGRGVAGRRRFAWALAVVTLAVATVAHLARGLDAEAAAATASVGGALVWKRRLFVVDPGPERLRRVLRVALTSVALAFAYGLGGLFLHARAVRGDLTVGRAVAEVAIRLVGGSGPLAVDGRFGAWFPASLTLLGTAIVAVVLLTALAPVADASPAAAWWDLSRLVDRSDGDTLDGFVIRRDKRHVFSPGGGAVIGYRCVHGVGLAAGDPVGDPAHLPAAVGAFVDLCDRQGWRPAVVGARGDRIQMWHAHGLRSLYIGDEAVVDVESFTLEGRRMRNVRQAVSRTVRHGYTTSVVPERDLDRDLRRRLVEIAHLHRGSFREFGFSMALGDMLEGVHPRCVVVVCRDEHGQPVAFQRYVVCRAGRSLSLDIMRRVPGALNGVNERMIVDVVAHARRSGATEVSLNFAAFRNLFDEVESPDGLRAAEAAVLRRFDGRLGLQLDTLRQFNAKFRPRWVPRAVVYRSPADIPAIAVAALSAEGFLPFDRQREPTPHTGAGGRFRARAR